MGSDEQVMLLAVQQSMLESRCPQLEESETSPAADTNDGAGRAAPAQQRCEESCSAPIDLTVTPKQEAREFPKRSRKRSRPQLGPQGCQCKRRRREWRKRKRQLKAELHQIKARALTMVGREDGDDG